MPSGAPRPWSASETATFVPVLTLCLLECREVNSNSDALELFLHRCFFQLTCVFLALLSRLSQALVSSKDKGESCSLYFRMRWMLKFFLLSSILMSSFSSSKVSCSLDHSLESEVGDLNVNYWNPPAPYDYHYY
jgi:hypothetical protein